MKPTNSYTFGGSKSSIPRIDAWKMKLVPCGGSFWYPNWTEHQVGGGSQTTGEVGGLVAVLDLRSCQIRSISMLAACTSTKWWFRWFGHFVRDGAFHFILAPRLISIGKSSTCRQHLRIQTGQDPNGSPVDTFASSNISKSTACEVIQCKGIWTCDYFTLPKVSSHTG